MPVMELMVLMAESASAPPRLAARATARMSVMLGVSLTRTGVRATSFTHSVIMQAYSGTWPTARAHAALAHAVRAAEVELQAVGAGVFGALDDVVPGLALRFHHQRRDDGVLRVALLDLGDLAEVDLDRAVGDELDVVEAHHALAVPIDRGVARGDVDDGLADGLPDGAAPAGVEGAHDLLAAVGGRSGGEPEGIGAADAGEVGGEVSHAAPPVAQHAERGALAVGHGVHHFAAAVDAIAAGVVFADCWCGRWGDRPRSRRRSFPDAAWR